MRGAIKSRRNHLLAESIFYSSKLKLSDPSISQMMSKRGWQPTKLYKHKDSATGLTNTSMLKSCKGITRVSLMARLVQSLCISWAGKGLSWGESQKAPTSNTSTSSRRARPQSLIWSRCSFLKAVLIFLRLRMHFTWQRNLIILRLTKSYAKNMTMRDAVWASHANS